jgi:glucose-6-phosphate isomerase
MQRQRKAGIIPYRDLPYNQDYPRDVKAMAAQVKGCENFVVLGIGGSALGNIALQTALNPYMYNQDAAQRNGNPRLFVFDNVDPMQLGSFLSWVGDKLDKTIFNVISKSGRTAETAAQFPRSLPRCSKTSSAPKASAARWWPRPIRVRARFARSPTVKSSARWSCRTVWAAASVCLAPSAC